MKNKNKNSILKNLIDLKTGMLFVFLLFILFYGYGKVSPEFSRLMENNKQVADLKIQVEDLKKQQESAVAEEQRRQTEMAQQKADANIYKSPYNGVNLETASVNLVDELLQKLEKTGNNVVEISYNSAPPSTTQTPTVGMPSELTLNISLNSSYEAFRGFLREIVLWQYLTAIKEINIDPVDESANRLAISFSIVLYVNL